MVIYNLTCEELLVCIFFLLQSVSLNIDYFSYLNHIINLATNKQKRNRLN